MDTNDPNLFEDQALRSALRRNLASEKAPEALRNRIRGLATRTSGQTPPTLIMPPPAPAIGNWAGMAIAAVLIVAAGAVALRLFTVAEPRVQYNEALGDNLASAMVTRHDLCNLHARPTHQFIAAPIGDFPRIAQVLEEAWGHPVLIADLRRDGWTFRGAALCNVGDQPCPHLLFDKGTATISVFTLPPSMTPAGAPGEGYAATLSGHNIVGFRQGNQMFCLVGSAPDGPPSTQTLRSLLDEHQTEIAAAPPHRQSKELAELMHDLP